MGKLSGSAFGKFRKKLPYSGSRRKLEFEGSDTGDGEWAGQFNIWRFTSADAPAGERANVEVSYDNVNRTWSVFWNDVLDYEGNKRDMLKRYPELKAHL